MKQELPFKIVCQFCNAPYTAQMEAEIMEYSGGCETCGPESADGTITVTCENCKRVVYKKEYKSYD